MIQVTHYGIVFYFRYSRWCFSLDYGAILDGCMRNQSDVVQPRNPVCTSQSRFGYQRLSMSLIRLDSNSKVRLSWTTNVKSMISTPKSPRHIKFRMRTSNDIEEGSYVSYCKLDGGMFSFVVFQAKCLLLCPPRRPPMISEIF